MIRKILVLCAYVLLLQTSYTVQIETQVNTAFADNIQLTSYITTSSTVPGNATTVYTFDPDIVIDDYAFGDDQGDTHGTCTIGTGVVTCQREADVNNFYYIHLHGHIRDCHSGMYTVQYQVALGSASDSGSSAVNVQNDRTCVFLPFIYNTPGTDHF